jgi:hypothetical protein
MIPLAIAALLGGCVAAQTYDALNAKYQQLKGSYNSEQAEIDPTASGQT